MSDASLHALADAAGLCVDWIDAANKPRRVAPPTLRAVLAALGYDARDGRACDDSLRRLRSKSRTPPLITADVDMPIDGGGAAGARYRLVDEDGNGTEGRFDAQGRIASIGSAGYYTLQHGDHASTLAIAPARCFGMADACGEPQPRRWGVAAQVYALRGSRDAGIGDAGAMAGMVDLVAAAGGDAIALSPLHSGRPVAAQYSPYSPSDRRFLDPLYAAPAKVLGDDVASAALHDAGLAAEFDALANAELVDWPRASRARWRWLHALYRRCSGLSGALLQDLARFRREGGDALEQYARFAVADHGHDAADAFELHVFAQWLAMRSWSSVQAQALSAGMAPGLIADLATGFDPHGAEAAAWRGAVLERLVLGAPPDAFNADGQVWGVTSYSPVGLREAGFRPFIELLRAAMRHRGGVRIDHILGLLRLWVVPADGTPGDGVYLRYPFEDLLRLLALESWRQRAVVIGEDLGVVPEGFRDTLERRGVLGIDVLMFTRDSDGAFLPPARWRRGAVATTTTHDLPTLVGWRAALDLAWRAHLCAGAVGADDLGARAQDVRRLREQVAATVGGDDADLSTWLRFVARSPSPLALLPLEDALALEQQPNLPGTVEGHPNWRRRLPEPLPHDTLARHLRAFAQERGHVRRESAA